MAEVAFRGARVAVQITLVGVLLGIPELESRSGVGCLGEVLGQNGGVGAGNEGAVGVQHSAASVGASVREAVRGLDRAGLCQLLKAGAPGEGRARYGDATLVVHEALRGGLGTNLVDTRKKCLGLRGVKGAGYAQCEARFACGGRGSAGDCRERRGALRTCVGGVLAVLLGVAGGRAVTSRGVAVSWGDVGVRRVARDRVIGRVLGEDGIGLRGDARYECAGRDDGAGSCGCECPACSLRGVHGTPFLSCPARCRAGRGPFAFFCPSIEAAMCRKRGTHTAYLRPCNT